MENIYIMEGYVIFQYSSEPHSKLCMLSKDDRQLDYGDAEEIGKYCHSQAPTPLDYFDNKNIVNIIQAQENIYFVTDQGRVNVWAAGTE